MGSLPPKKKFVMAVIKIFFSSFQFIPHEKSCFFYFYLLYLKFFDFFLNTYAILFTHSDWIQLLL